MAELATELADSLLAFPTLDVVATNVTWWCEFSTVLVGTVHRVRRVIFFQESCIVLHSPERMNCHGFEDIDRNTALAASE